MSVITNVSIASSALKLRGMCVIFILKEIRFTTQFGDLLMYIFLDNKSLLPIHHSVSPRKLHFIHWPVAKSENWRIDKY